MALSCIDQGLSGDGVAGNGDVSLLEPDIVVDPGLLDFGVLDAAAGEQLTQVVTVRNKGDADLALQGLFLEDPAGPFAFSVFGSKLLRPGQETTFTVTYMPTASAQDSGRVLVESNDPDTPTLAVELLGRGVAPDVEVDPLAYDFGETWVGCDLFQPVRIGNEGDADLIVHGFEFNTGSSDMVLDTAEDLYGSLPWTLAPGGWAEVAVLYVPLDAYADTAYLTVISNDPADPTVLATQTGSAEVWGENIDVYEQPVEGRTDILFSMDWSGSMSDNIANALANFEVFVETLLALDADFHLAAVTADDGCIYNGGPTFIDETYSVSEAVAVFSDMVNLAGSGGNTERLFSVFEAALQNEGEGAAGCNAGFYRDGATLNLVSVSDEPEQSSASYASYVSLFQGMKDDADDVRMHAIAGDYPTGCGGAGGGADYGAGYYEAALATGGTYLSICALDFGAHMETLAEGSAQALDSFSLSELPVPETLLVKVDGLVTVVGWSYDVGDNAVVFEADAVPEGGSTVEIGYATQGDCEG
jgi:hypothetical protein